MRKVYQELEVEITKFSFFDAVHTISDPNAFDYDEYDLENLLNSEY